MKAVLIHRHADGAVLALGEIPEPELGHGQVRVSVRAVSVNYADQFVPQGGYGTPPADGVPWVAGLDAAGVVTEVGAGVSGVRVGDRVMAMVASSLAEQVVTDARFTVPVPSTWSDEEGAAAIVGLLTECSALAAAGGLRGGESVVITGATSGMGLQGVQLARHLGAGRIIAVARSDRADDVLHRLGADLVLHSAGCGYADRVLDATAGAGADVAVDHVGGSYFPDLVAAAAIGGRIVNVGRAAGAEATADLEAFSLKQLTLRGVTFRTRTRDELGDLYQQVRDLDLGKLRPVIERVVPWEETEEAQGLLSTGTVVGKVVIRVAAES
ncbi:quinone oxidoreductase family protein [Pseudonocardia broussonetiae]|uniref:Zinc-binding dehydrogenase n=1 Tax=Pseudonocardia broussonetiae TaxID=2736640 RepID=A0A6M6JV36_9PSEU|nr:zinc-binding dehydrogenase [Pseudonocardia broussonetiae]QJY49991.1 zinc-binding dehydrogenase [Pseudonocardia broussonetiae]